MVIRSILHHQERQQLLGEIRSLVEAIKEIKELKPELDDVMDWGSYDTRKMGQINRIIDGILEKYTTSEPVKNPSPYNYLFGSDDND